MTEASESNRPEPSGVYRYTSIARPVDPAFPTNRALLFLLPIIAVVNAGLAGFYDIGASPLAAALAGALTGFAGWALTRELAPDDNAAAFLALALAWAMQVFAGANGVLLLFVALFVVRIVNRSTGLSARWFDTLSVLGLSTFAAYSLQQPLLLLVAAIAFLLDVFLKDGRREHIVAAAVCAIGFIGLLVSQDISFRFGELGRNDWLAIILLYFANRALTFQPATRVSVCDVYGEPLDKARVNAGLVVGLAVAIQAIVTVGPDAWTDSPIWACFIAVPASAVVQTLRARIDRKGSPGSSRE